MPFTDVKLLLYKINNFHTRVFEFPKIYFGTSKRVKGVLKWDVSSFSSTVGVITHSILYYTIFYNVNYLIYLGIVFYLGVEVC